MFVLQLNDMRASNVENLQPRARAETREELEQFMANEKVETYADERWRKSYRQGGPLEWCNPPFQFNEAIVDVGSADEWAANAIRRFEEQIMTLPTAP